MTMKLPVLLALAALMTAPPASLAAPAGFELDLKELKKPSPTLITPPKRVTTPQITKPQPTAKAPAKKVRPAAKTAQRAPKIAPAPQQTAEQLALLDGATACIRARLLLEAVAKPIPVEDALQGLILPAIAAGRHQGATVVLACDLPTAEAYTFGRLLEADGVTLINLAADAAAELTVATVAEALGLSYRLLQDNPLSYLTSDQQGRPLRLVIGTSSTSN